MHTQLHCCLCTLESYYKSRNISAASCSQYHKGKDKTAHTFLRQGLTEPRLSLILLNAGIVGVHHTLNEVQGPHACLDKHSTNKAIAHPQSQLLVECHFGCQPIRLVWDTVYLYMHYVIWPPRCLGIPGLQSPISHRKTGITDAWFYVGFRFKLRVSSGTSLSCLTPEFFGNYIKVMSLRLSI